jgi:hypothetical protein
VPGEVAGSFGNRGRMHRGLNREEGKNAFGKVEENLSNDVYLPGRRIDKIFVLVDEFRGKRCFFLEDIATGPIN